MASVHDAGAVAETKHAEAWPQSQGAAMLRTPDATARALAGLQVYAGAPAAGPEVVDGAGGGPIIANGADGSFAAAAAMVMGGLGGLAVSTEGSAPQMTGGRQSAKEKATWSTFLAPLEALQEGVTFVARAFLSRHGRVLFTDGDVWSCVDAEQLLALPCVLEGESSVHAIPTDHFQLGQRKFLVVQRDVDMVFAMTNDAGAPLGGIVMLIGTLGVLCVLFQYVYMRSS